MSVTSERAVDSVYRRVREEILTRALEPGQRLQEMELAGRYGISRTPIREALRRLEQDGLVTVEPHRGARVYDWRDLDIAVSYDLRALVEGYAARRAANLIREDEIEELGELCDRMEYITATYACGDPILVTEMSELSMQFHAKIADHAQAYQIAAIRNVVIVVPMIFSEVHTYSTEHLTRANADHRELLSAFAARDPEWAQSLATSHVHAAKARLLSHIQEDELLLDSVNAGGPPTPSG